MFNLFGFGKSKAKRILALVDCKDGSIQETGTFPAIAGDSGKLKIEGRGELFEASISRENRVVLTPLQHERSFKLLVNGSDFKEPVEIGAVATLQVGEGLYYIITDEFQLERAKNMDVSRWLIFYAESGRIEDEVPFSRIKSAVLNRGLSGAGIAVCPRNFETGFMFSSVFGSEVANSQMAVPILPESSVATTCPLCWLKFDLGDAMSIASHESLRGDSILGPDEMLRFLPTSFNEDGVPLDPVEWCEDGRYYPEDFAAGKTALHEGGAYYIQEASAMLPATLLDARPGELVLDLCAAPGGKSGQLAAAMRGEGLLVCNEVVPSRAAILSRNIERLGVRPARAKACSPKTRTRAPNGRRILRRYARRAKRLSWTAPPQCSKRAACSVTAPAPSPPKRTNCKSRTSCALIPSSNLPNFAPRSRSLVLPTSCRKTSRRNACASCPTSRVATGTSAR